MKEFEDAIRTLMVKGKSYGWDFVVRITGPAFQEQGKESTLEFRQKGYGQPTHKGFEIAYNGTVLAQGEFEELLEIFLKTRKEKELGSDFIDSQGICVCSPSKSSKSKIKIQKNWNLPIHSWVYDRTKLGFVISNGDYEGWYRIWFGEGQIIHMPSYSLEPCDKPSETCLHMTPFKL